MENDELKMMMLKFLNRNFPIGKVKKDGAKRFRRGIYIPSGFTGKEDLKFYIGEKKDLDSAYAELFRILESVFGVSPTEINSVLLVHLNLF